MTNPENGSVVACVADSHSDDEREFETLIEETRQARFRLTELRCQLRLRHKRGGKQAQKMTADAVSRDDDP